MGKWKYLGGNPNADYDAYEIDPRSPQQRKEDLSASLALQSKEHEEFKLKDELVSRWNVTGQYLKVDDFHFPVKIDRISRNETYWPSFWEADCVFKDIRVSIFRLVDADESSAWMLFDEFRKTVMRQRMLSFVCIGPSKKWW
jgi:hypothetical protein